MKQQENSKSVNFNPQMFDVIIIGGGAAGLSAGAWCDELGLNALLLESDAELGGQLLRVYNPIKNHLGVEVKDGRRLRDIFLKQVENRKFAVHTKSEVVDVNTERETVALKNGIKFSAQTLIIATGVTRRKLDIEGEEKFYGRGIIESGKRDKNLVAEKHVCIIGGGDAAFENALVLSETASEILLVHRRKNFRARADFIKKIKNNPKVKILTETVVTKIIGSKMVEAVEMKNLKTNKNFIVPIGAILIRIGVEPNTELFRGKLKLDKSGYIKINNLCETSVENVFAIGDVANEISPTISTAVGMGATVAKVIFHKLHS